MDLGQFLHVSEQAESATGLIIYIIAGVGILLVILILVWLLIKLSNALNSDKNGKKKEKSEDEELFG